jgi:hypothetical protein
MEGEPRLARAGSDRPSDARGQFASVEGDLDREDELLLRIVVDGTEVAIETTVRGYRLDLSRVDRGDIEAAIEVLRRMRRHCGSVLALHGPSVPDTTSAMVTRPAYSLDLGRGLRTATARVMKSTTWSQTSSNSPSPQPPSRRAHPRR